MTELQLLCSPFRVVELTIQACCDEPLPEHIAIELERVANLIEQGYIRILQDLSKRIYNSDSIDYRVVIPALNSNLSNDLYYGRLSSLLPDHIMTCLQGKLPEFPAQANINWEKLVSEYLPFYQYAVKYAQIGEYNLGLVDTYTSCSFTSILLYFISNNVDYEEVEVERQLEWILTCIAKDRDLFLNLYDNELIEKGDLVRVMSIKHDLQEISRQLKNYPRSPLIPKWVRDHPAEKVAKSADSKIEGLKEIELTIKEKQKYNLRSKSAPSESEINTFVDLFVSSDDVLKYTRILREATKSKPVINDLGRWIGKRGSISILIAWIEVLQERGKFKTQISESQLTELLNKYFPDLNLNTGDTSIWRKLTKTRNLYHADFLQLIKK